MPQVQHRRRINTKAAVALLLTFAAGCVDIIGYITLYHAFTAHMTGETVHLAQNVLEGRWPDGLKAACVIAAFLLGSIAGRIIIEIGARKRARSVASATLLIEAALIIAVVPIAQTHTASEPEVLVLLAMLAFAMGMQTATLTRVGSLTVHTTFVTGMLNKLAQLLSQSIFLTYDGAQGQDTAAVRKRVFRRAQFIFSIWLLYLSGAATGVWMSFSWGIQSLLLPAVLVGAAIAADQMAPLTVEEEQDQSER